MYEAFSYLRESRAARAPTPSLAYTVTSVWGLELLVYAALRY